jgi:mono/diheme cytochrome c family protein/Flp pilus assembly protein TadD
VTIVRGKNIAEAPQSKPLQRSSLWRIATWTCLFLAALALLLFGRSAGGWVARTAAQRSLDHLALSRAMRWLDRAEQVQPRAGSTQLLRARCYRQWGEWPAWDKALELAKRSGVSSSAIRQEEDLGKIQRGEIPEQMESKFRELSEAGLSPHDVATAFVLGFIALEKTEEVESLSRAWQADYPEHPQVLYVRGVLLASQNDPDGARKALEEALAAAPDHELAQLALARHFAAQKEFDIALTRYLQLAKLHPTNTGIMIGLSRVLRQLGRHTQARAALAQLDDAGHPISPLSIERGQVDLETGDYARALLHFDRVAGQDMTNRETITAASLALGLSGDTTAADRAFLWIADEITAVAQLHDLPNRQAVDPTNTKTEATFRDLMKSLAARRNEGSPYKMALAPRPTAADDTQRGQALYEDHCAACHGAEGNGDGRAARHVFPRPRNLRIESTRLVHTVNGIPTAEDIRNLIRQGVPGTSMAANTTLPDADLDRLANLVLQMRRDGARDTYVATLQQEGEHVDEEDVAEFVRSRTTPGEIVVPPDMKAPTAESLTRGKELYIQQACHSCHGHDGTGDNQTPCFDTLGQPAFPRDLVHDLFKGGNTPDSVYLRILLGMPGSPHPANSILPQAQLVDLVQYCQSLGVEPKKVMTNHQRSIQAASRPAITFATTP